MVVGVVVVVVNVVFIGKYCGSVVVVVDIVVICFIYLLLLLFFLCDISVGRTCTGKVLGCRSESGGAGMASCCREQEVLV